MHRLHSQLKYYGASHASRGGIPLEPGANDHAGLARSSGGELELGGIEMFGVRAFDAQPFPDQRRDQPLARRPEQLVPGCYRARPLRISSTCSRAIGSLSMFSPIHPVNSLSIASVQ